MNDNRWGGRLRFAVPGLCLVLCLATTGCGGTGGVSGKISYKGEAVGGGTVMFVSEGNGTVTADIGPDGTYRLDKVPPGPVKIAVETKSAKPAQGPPMAMPTPPPDAMPKDGASPMYGPPSQPKGKYVAIPDSYADPKTSGLSYTVKSGPQPYDIDLK